jgi:hypothetical protein
MPLWFPNRLTILVGETVVDRKSGLLRDYLSLWSLRKCDKFAFWSSIFRQARGYVCRSNVMFDVRGQELARTIQFQSKPGGQQHGFHRRECEVVPGRSFWTDIVVRVSSLCSIERREMA